MSPAGPASRPPADRRRALLLGAAMAACVAAVFGQVAGFAFVNVDDQQYVTDNPWVLQGLRAPGIAWAFGFRAANWHPLTWLSHMLDADLFGAWAGGPHLVNALLHLAATLLLFGLLRAATGATGRSAAAALLFGVHPLHAESVAWVAERKDVLSAALGLLAAWAYVRAVRRPGPPRLRAVALLHALALLAKPMLVSLPLLLLLLDAWPLGRLRGREELWPRLREKIPLLALSAASSALTVLAQAEGGAVAALTHIPLPARLANAVVSLAAYLRDAFLPVGLASFYPHPALVLGGVPALHLAAAAAALAALGALAWRQARAWPFLAFGLAWHAVALLPVLGIVQVGEQARADRYMYLPLAGVLVAVVWSAEALVARVGRAWVGAALAAAAAAALAALAIPQVATWRSSIALHERAVAVTERNWKAWQGLCDARSDAGDLAGAVAACRESLAIAPGHAEAWNGLGVAAGRLGRHEEAIRDLSEAVRVRPGYADAWYNLGTAHGSLGRHAEALPCFREAVRLRPDHARAWFNLGIATLAAGDRRGAAEIAAFLRGLDPERADALQRIASP